MGFRRITDWAPYWEAQNRNAPRWRSRRGDPQGRLLAWRSVTGSHPCTPFRRPTHVPAFRCHPPRYSHRRRHSRARRPPSPALANGDDDGNDWGGQHSRQDNNQEFTEGRVTAVGGLTLRDRPTPDSRAIGLAPQGSTVRIFCRTPGATVDGNHLWYLLADGVWAWGSARYIDIFGHEPRWC
ncbi:SH3 domain-containing protein [Streptomyces vastus]|uniref:SH3b domain-containing protein n=1 Tax=Streptomyces vastus TaxID=285451 RepID=A0ABN3QPD3_9ACTN